jgi:hypothetical protein
MYCPPPRHRISAARAAAWRGRALRTLFPAWRRGARSARFLRMAFHARLLGSVRRHTLAHCLRVLRECARRSLLQRRMTAYFLSRARQRALLAWRDLFLLRRALRSRLLALQAGALSRAGRGRRRALSLAFGAWRAAGLAPRLDLLSLGRAALRLWRLCARARRCRRRGLLRRPLLAWRARVGSLGRARARVLALRGACAVLDTR